MENTNKKLSTLRGEMAKQSEKEIDDQISNLRNEWGRMHLSKSQKLDASIFFALRRHGYKFTNNEDLHNFVKTHCEHIVSPNFNGSKHHVVKIDKEEIIEWDDIPITLNLCGN